MTKQFNPNLLLFHLSIFFFLGGGALNPNWPLLSQLVLQILTSTYPAPPMLCVKSRSSSDLLFPAPETGAPMSGPSWPSCTSVWSKLSRILFPLPPSQQHSFNGLGRRDSRLPPSTLLPLSGTWMWMKSATAVLCGWENVGEPGGAGGRTPRGGKLAPFVRRAWQMESLRQRKSGLIFPIIEMRQTFICIAFRRFESTLRCFRLHLKVFIGHWGWHPELQRSSPTPSNNFIYS